MLLYEDIGISLVAYGSLNPQAIHSYKKIRSAYNLAFPGADIQLAFTSDFVRHKLSEKQGIFFHSPLISLTKLRNKGYKKWLFNLSILHRGASSTGWPG